MVSPFSSIDNSGRILLAVCGPGVAVALLVLAWYMPSALPSFFAAEVVAGIAVASPLVATSVAISARRGGARSRVRALLVAGDDDSGIAKSWDRLAARLELVGCVAISAEPGDVAGALSAHRPQLLLVEAPLSEVRFELLQLCSERGVRVLVPLCPSYGVAVDGPIVRLGGLPWLALRPMPLARRHRIAKRAFDVLLVLLFAPLVLSLVGAVALAVAATSPGGVLYRQVRLGQGGRPFVLLKFRTMRAGAEAETGPVLAGPEDTRVTRVGGFLRRIHLDELPQLWNVLRGDMSLVGPRPERPEFVDLFRNIPEYDYRHLLKPGLTGLAQLVGGYSASAADKVRCDLLYLSRRSLLLDLRLLVTTLFDLVRGFPVG